MWLFKPRKSRPKTVYTFGWLDDAEVQAFATLERASETLRAAFDRAGWETRALRPKAAP